MNDNQGWINGLFTTLIGLVAFMLNLYRRKVDRLEEEHRELVTKADLMREMDQIRADRIRMHEENVDRLKGVGSDVRAVHMRIDQLFNGKAHGK